MALSFKNQLAIKRGINKLLVVSAQAAFTKEGIKQKLGRFCTKAGVPSDDTTADLAPCNGCLCWNTTSDYIYIASNVAAATTTWTRIV
jgi:hypothetical protein